jgi:hypothetical protein
MGWRRWPLTMRMRASRWPTRTSPPRWRCESA